MVVIAVVGILGLVLGGANMAWASGQVVDGIGGGVVASLNGNALPSIAIVLLLAFTVVYAFRAMESDAGPQPVAS